MSRDSSDTRSKSDHLQSTAVHSGRAMPGIDFEAEHDAERAQRRSRMRLFRYAKNHGIDVRGQADANATAKVDRAASDSGAPLPNALRDRFESSLGADLSDVRVHTGAASASAAESVGARAYATGQDIHVGAGEYDPSSKDGQHLLAHEVAHTVQQGNASTAQPQAKLEVSGPADSQEQEADRAADAMLAGRPASVSSLGSAMVQRKEAGEDHRNPFEQPQRPPRNQSRADGSAFAFDPPTLTFHGAGEEQVTVRNTTSEPQTIDQWQLAGDSSAFNTTFVGARSVVVQPGQSLSFRVRFLSEKDMPQSAALVVDSMFGDAPARLNIVGVKRGAGPSGAAEANDGCSTVKISATTPEGRSNSVQSAINSVGAAFTSMLSMKSKAISQLEGIVGKELPKATPLWKTKLDGIIAQGLSKLIGAVGMYMGGGLALATWNVLEGMGLGREGAAAGAKEVAALTLKVHQLVTSSLAQGVLTSATTAAREAIANSTGVEPSVQMRDAFFDAQAGALSAGYQDAITTLNNSEGDYAALEANHPGLGFAALEAYRSHISCHAGHVAELQRSAIIGMWMALLAQLDLGTHEPADWEHAKPGAAVEKNLYNSTDAHHRIRDLARGVLELHVIWDFDHMRSNPIYQIEKARVEGIHPELKQRLLGLPLCQFAMPVIVHGKVKQDTTSGTAAVSHLRIGRNEGGAISLGAEPKTRGAEMLETLGNGDAFAGGRVLFEYIDQLTLTKVE